jgi:two-component system, chemotaxis family, protein-glutamate methylesterase/glutaminase
MDMPPARRTGGIRPGPGNGFCVLLVTLESARFSGSRECVEPRDVVVVGGSAGSLGPLRELAAELPADLPGSVVVTVHVGEHAPSRLPLILSRSGPLPTTHAKTGERLRPGRGYVAPPGCHLLLPGGVVELSNGPRVNRSRPAVDVMFGSAARWFGDRVVAVVLSGVLDDGAVGAALVAQAGGLVVVQEPAEAAQPSMPRAALAAAPGAIAVPGRKLGEMVSGMLGEGGLATWPRPAQDEAAEVSMEEGSDLQFLSPGETRLTRLACPECGGALAEAVLPRITYYRCHVGHQFGPQSLAAAQAESAEAKLWAAVAALKETAALARHLAEHGDIAADDADQQSRTADRAARLAEALRVRAREAP